MRKVKTWFRAGALATIAAAVWAVAACAHLADRRVDDASEPVQLEVITNTSTPISELDRAHKTSYSAAVRSVWSTVPETSGAALDALATIAGGAGTAVTAASAFGDDNAILVADGTGRGAKANNSLLSDGSTFKFPITNTPAVWELVSAGTAAVNWLATTNNLTGNDCVLAARGEAARGIQFWDSNNTELLLLNSVASAVNELTIGNAATTNDPSIAASGETNVGIIIASKGTGVVSIPGVGTGGYTDYDLTIGDVTTPDYGMMHIGHGSIGMTSHNAGNIDLDRAMLFRNIGGPATGEIEFIFAESTGTTCRFALPKSAVGNATYNPRSLLNAGPAPADTDFVKVSYWQGQGIFDNLVCDTAGDGADLGVQNDLEVEGDVFTDSILESTTDAGVTIDGVPIKDGEVDGRNVADLLAFFNGTFVESFDALVTSDGATVTMSIEQDGGGDLTMQFSDGQTTLDCTPAATIALTAGSDASPTGNFIYVPQSTKVLTKSTSDWPSAEHIKIGYFLVPSPGFVQANGVYVNHNTNDHAQGTDGQGHLVHITERLRSQHAIYKSGVALTMTVGGGTTVDVAVTSGIVYQMHKHATPALDTATGDAVLVINQNGTAYDDVTDLESLTNDSTGTAVKKYFNWTFVGVGNKGGEYSPLMLQLPTGSYNQQASAESDVSGFDVLTIPGEFSSDSQTGFLIARVTMSLIGGTWAHVSTVDLRGATPQTVVGGVGGVDTEFADNAFKLFNVTDNTKVLDFQLSSITTATTRTITMADADVDLAQMVTLTGTQTLTNKTLTTPVVAIVHGAGGDETLILTDVGATAVNEVTITNAATTAFPSVEATGGDTHIDLSLLGKGTAAIRTNAPLKIGEVAAAIGDTAAFGQIWVKSDTPNNLWFTDDAGTDHPVAQDIGCRVYDSTDTAITHNTATALTWDNERWDSDSMWEGVTNPTRITFNTAGKYIVGVTVRWEANGTGYRQLGIRVNGTNHISIVKQDADAINSTAMQECTTVWEFAATDYIEVMVRQTSGGNLDVDRAADFSPECYAQFLGT